MLCMSAVVNSDREGDGICISLRVQAVLKRKQEQIRPPTIEEYAPHHLDICNEGE